MGWVRDSWGGSCGPGTLPSHPSPEASILHYPCSHSFTKTPQRGRGREISWEGLSSPPRGTLYCRSHFGGDQTEKSPKRDMPKAGRRSPHTTPALWQEVGGGGGRDQQQHRGQEAGVSLRSDDSSWGLGLQPLQSRCLPFGSCCCVGGRLMPQILSSALGCCSRKGHPVATPETHPGHPGNGQHPHLLPSNDKGGQRGSEARVPMCMPSLPTPLWAGRRALGYETHPAYACCPTTDIKVSSTKVVL